MPFISVIVPVYNNANYLPRCVESILAQTVSDFELILVDDGSTDGSKAVCEIYAKKDARVRVIAKDNGGVSSARNVGIDESKGDWIAFVDGDDFLSSDYLEKLYPGDCDLSIGSVDYSSPDGSIIWAGRHENSGIETVDKSKMLIWFERKSLYSVWTSIFRSEFIRDYHLYFDTNTTRGEDTIFMFQYVELCTRVKFVSDVVYYYVQYGKEGSSSSKTNLKNIMALNYLDQFIENWLKQNGLRSMKFESCTYWTKIAQADYFSEILSSKGWSFPEKKTLLKTILSLPNFYKHTEHSYKYANPLFKFLLRIKSPNLLILYYRIRQVFKRKYI